MSVRWIFVRLSSVFRSLSFFLPRIDSLQVVCVRCLCVDNHEVVRVGTCQYTAAIVTERTLKLIENYIIFIEFIELRAYVIMDIEDRYRMG